MTEQTLRLIQPIDSIKVCPINEGIVLMLRIDLPIAKIAG